MGGCVVFSQDVYNALISNGAANYLGAFTHDELRKSKWNMLFYGVPGTAAKFELRISRRKGLFSAIYNAWMGIGIV